MTDKTRNRTALVQFADPEAPGGPDTRPQDFLRACRASALARFRKGFRPATCRTIEKAVATPASEPGRKRRIRLLVSSQLMRAWTAGAPGGLLGRKAHVDEQLELIFEDLGFQSMRGFVPLRPADEAACAEDVKQLVAEAIERAGLGGLAPLPAIAWEGTLVTSVKPTSIVVVVSLGI